MTTKTSKNQTDEIKYIDDKEFSELQQFGEDGGFLQYALGLELCKTKGDVVQLLTEISNRARTQAINEFADKIFKELKKENSTNPNINAIITRGSIIQIINKIKSEMLNTSYLQFGELDNVTGQTVKGANHTSPYNQTKNKGDKMKLNLGCGNDIKEGYINLDISEHKGVNVIHNLNDFPYPFADNYFEEIYARGVLSELNDFIKVMDELYRISKNKAEIIVEESYFGELAFQHPLTKKVFVKDSFNYFPSQYSKSRFKIIRRGKFYSHNYLHNFFAGFVHGFTFGVFWKPRFIRWGLEVEK